MKLRHGRDGARIAAVTENGLAIIDATTRKELSTAPWPRADANPEDLLWSPDGKYVLSGLYGEQGGAGDPQSDYFLLNVAARTWRPAITAQKALWLPGGAVLLYMRPVETTPLAPGSAHNVWTTQFAVFDLATRKDTQLTTGLVLNDYLSSCGH